MSKVSARGVCGVCRCRLVSDDVTYNNRAPHALWSEDIDQGHILPCIAYATSDLSLDRLLAEKNSRVRLLVRHSIDAMDLGPFASWFAHVTRPFLAAL